MVISGLWLTLCAMFLGGKQKKRNDVDTDSLRNSVFESFWTVCYSVTLILFFIEDCWIHSIKW